MKSKGLRPTIPAIVSSGIGLASSSSEPYPVTPVSVRTRTTTLRSMSCMRIRA